ncbi:AMP phosphorylase [Halogeometricum borinquense]|uniref:AMP phosphorylase n=1 Tax=Halogeometricum borinquense TaxID=60847 RepID=A0A6C0UER0_9EURY|nr:AMP phosphorylase [Halogeometricum borinquense]QIB73690.1 AMP phosphorylase [Halogeometricum borinquense]QIQ76953.1 AMP phosphorylase [Halogeometricum borinquense]
MQLTTVDIDIGTRAPTVLMHGDDAATLGLHPLDRVQIETESETVVGIVELSNELVDTGELAVTRRLGHIDGTVEVTPAPRPSSVEFIRKKLDDDELEYDELDRIVRDIRDDRLSDVELGAYVCAMYINGTSLSETMHLSESMADAGEKLSWEADIVADKHCVGGVSGNRTTPIIVSIVAAAGVTIPKTSSRAVTSAAGTADTMEVFCPVDLSAKEIRTVVAETNGCIAWGGAVNLSPVDDKIIRAETPLSLDPHGQLVASVLSKKQSAGSTHVLVDIPYGEGAKVGSLDEARELAHDFGRVGDHLGMTIDCAITGGSAPIGRGVGPVLEARDVLSVLTGSGPGDLRRKSVRLAQILLDCVGADADASEILESGRALDRFSAIVAAQGGDPDVLPSELVPGRYEQTVTAGRDGVVTHINNRLVNDVARRAGAPRAPGSGLELHHSVGDAVAQGDPLYTIHAEASERLSEAAAYAEDAEAVRIRPPDETLVEQL